MGFFNELGKAFMGKPLGPDKPEQTPEDQPTAPNTQQSNGLVDESGRKIIPTIEVKSLRSQRQGDKLIVKAWIVNHTNGQAIRVDSSYLLKQKRQHNQEINPGDSRELTFYDGPAPRNDNEHNAQIMYRLQQNGDVFMESYRVEYSLESDGVFIVEELHSDGPVRDL